MLCQHSVSVFCVCVEVHAAVSLAKTPCVPRARAAAPVALAACRRGAVGSCNRVVWCLIEIRQSTIYYGLLGPWEKRIVDQVSDVPSIILFYAFY